jgi:hypothetical protein
LGSEVTGSQPSSGLASHARNVDRTLDADRDTMKRAKFFPTEHSGLRNMGSLAGAGGVQVNEGI